MNRLQPLNLYMVLMAVFIAALMLGLLFFIVGLNEVSYLVTDGVRYGIQFLDKPRYEQYLQGVIFTGFFLVAGLLFLFVIAVPDEHPQMAQGQMPPQPRRRPPMPLQQAPAPQPAPQQPAALPTPPPQPISEAAPAEPEPTIEEGVGEATEAPAPATAPKPPVASVDEEVLTSSGDPEIAMPDLPDERQAETGEDDVVYGSGRVTSDSIWDFVLAYPDSAVKFLYRKTLENKQLSPVEEDIYRKWEMRGMTRGKVRELVLDVMRWRRLPDDFPHNIWRDLRDQIFDMKTR